MDHWWNVPFFPAGQPSSAPDLTNAKRHAACDKCRSRKLKCTGETTGCARCQREGLPCNYSLQKPMGRPRRKKEEQKREASPQLHDNYYTSNYGDNGVAPSSNHYGAFTASSQENEPAQIYVATDVPMDYSSPSASTTYTSTSSYCYTPPHVVTPSNKDKPCVYGDPAMLVPNIRYNHVLLPLDICSPKQ